MSLRTRFYITGKIGPGGIKCPCCADGKHKRRKNRRLGRLARSWAKREWKRNEKVSRYI